MDLYLVRHTRVAVGSGICYGQLDVALADSASSDMALTLGLLPHKVGKVFSSPLSRCLALAQKISSEVTIDVNLRELHFGAWEGQPWSEISRAEIDLWAQDFATKGPPQGESFSDLCQRISLALQAMHDSGADSVVSVTHGGVIRAFICLALGLPATRAFDFEVDYGSVTHLKWPAKGHRRIVSTNLRNKGP